MEVKLEESVRNVSKLRVYALVESTMPEVSREIGEFLSEAISRPIEVKAGSINIAMTFLWSLINRVAKHLEEAGEQVLDVGFTRGKTVIITRSGYAINIVVRMRHNQYVSEIEGVVEVEESPFKIEDF